MAAGAADGAAPATRVGRARCSSDAVGTLGPARRSLRSEPQRNMVGMGALSHATQPTPLRCALSNFECWPACWGRLFRPAPADPAAPCGFSLDLCGHAAAWLRFRAWRSRQLRQNTPRRRRSSARRPPRTQTASCCLRRSSATWRCVQSSSAARRSRTGSCCKTGSTGSLSSRRRRPSGSPRLAAGQRRLQGSSHVRCGRSQPGAGPAWMRAR